MNCSSSADRLVAAAAFGTTSSDTGACTSGAGPATGEADDGALERFDVLMDVAQYNLRLTEDHSYWIDQMGVAAFR